MGVETKVILKGKVTPRQVANALKSQLGVDSKVEVDTKDIPYFEDAGVVFLGQIGVAKTTSGTIKFTYKGESRMIHYFHTDALVDLKYRLETAISVNDLGFAGELTHLSLGYGGVAVEVMSALAKHFKGCIDEDDCDEFGYHKVV